MQIMSGDSRGRADVEMRLPADSAYVSVLRTTAAGVAARLDFPLDDVEDLRMAVSEAAAIVLAGATAESDLTTRFWIGERAISVTIGVDHADAGDGDPHSLITSDFAWQVLTTLASETTVSAAGGRLEISLTVHATPLQVSG